MITKEGYDRLLAVPLLTCASTSITQSAIDREREGAEGTEEEACPRLSLGSLARLIEKGQLSGLNKMNSLDILTISPHYSYSE